MADRLEAKLDEYAERFDDGFPMMPLAWGRTDDEVIELIDKCLDEGKDAYDMGMVNDEDIY